MDKAHASNQHDQHQHHLSRRGFFKAAATATVATAAGGALAACSPTAPAADGNASDKAKAAFEAASAPIEPVEAPASWDVEADVIVVGSGGGGMTGSVRLADAGMSVIMLEKNEKTGGTTSYGGMFVNLGGHRMANEVEWAYPTYPYDPNAVVTYINDLQQMTVDPELLYAMAVEGPQCIDWMADAMDVPWAPSSKGPSGMKSLYWDGQITAKNSIEINHYPFEIMTETAKAHGVDIRTNTEALALVMDGGTVVGIKAKTPDGEKFFHGKKAVLLTAGGFEMNRAMLAKYTPTCLRGIVNVATPPYNDGACIRMGLGAGADLSGYDSVACFDGSVGVGALRRVRDRHERARQQGRQSGGAPAVAAHQPHGAARAVPQHGRFVLPLPQHRSQHPGHGAHRPRRRGDEPAGRAHVCFDSKFETARRRQLLQAVRVPRGQGHPDDDPLVDRVPEWQRDWRNAFQIMVDAGAVKECDTIEELEQELGLREGVLVKAVEDWNKACEAGEDSVPTYKYDPEWLIPIGDPPYYGAKIGGNLFATKCGLRINPQMQVIDVEGAVIEGLYAGWHTAGGSNGENNIAGKPFNGLFGDVGLSFVGGWPPQALSSTPRPSARAPLASPRRRPPRRRGPLPHTRQPTPSAASARSPSKNSRPQESRRCSSYSTCRSHGMAKSSTENILMSGLVRKPERDPASAMPNVSPTPERYRSR